MKPLKNTFCSIFLLLICTQIYAQTNNFQLSDTTNKLALYSQNTTNVAHDLANNETWKNTRNLDSYTDPEILSTTEASICGIGSATISATANKGTILWYDAQTGGNLLFTGSDFTTPVIDTPTTYFATVSLKGYSNTERTPVNVDVSKPPIIIHTTHDLICSTTAEISATASSGNVYWYDSATSTTPFFIGSDFEASGITSDTTYYVEAKNGECTSNSRIEVYIVVEAAIPVFKLAKNSYFLSKNKSSITLKAKRPEGNYTYVWKKDTIKLPENTASITVKKPGTYTVKAVSNVGCESEEKTIIVKRL